MDMSHSQNPRKCMPPASHKCLYLYLLVIVSMSIEEKQATSPVWAPSLQYGKLKITAPSYMLYYYRGYFNADCTSLLLKEGESIYVDVYK